MQNDVFRILCSDVLAFVSLVRLVLVSIVRCVFISKFHASLMIDASVRVTRSKDSSKICPAKVAPKISANEVASKSTKSSAGM